MARRSISPACVQAHDGIEMMRPLSRRGAAFNDHPRRVM
jgi:hypothetical protein